MENTDVSKIIKILKQLSFLAFYDELTKILNRRGFFNKIREQGIFAKSRAKEKRKKKHALILIDINKFKLINDRYGYKIGDRILKLIAKSLKKNFRQEDIIARWGGDEFLIICHEIGENELRKKLKILEARVDEKLNKYGASLGIVYEMFPYGSNFNKIFKIANKKLMKIKQR